MGKKTASLKVGGGEKNSFLGQNIDQCGDDSEEDDDDEQPVVNRIRNDLLFADTSDDDETENLNSELIIID